MCQEFEEEEEKVVLEKRMRRLVKLGIGGIEADVRGVGPALLEMFPGGSPQRRWNQDPSRLEGEESLRDSEAESVTWKEILCAEGGGC